MFDELLHFNTEQPDAAAKAAKIPECEEYLCWSRMQAEAGQKLDRIILRKENERVSGNGHFFWGVGNAPALAARKLAIGKKPVKVVFSIMKSKPKRIDLRPSRILVWRKYFDLFGVERSLPPNVLVTSRGHEEWKAKQNHYALMCYSERPLELERGVPFHPNEFRNVGGTGAQVGASQVTAIVRRVATSNGPSSYEVNLHAWLTGSYWVRLSDPSELKPEHLSKIEGLHSVDISNWLGTVEEIRGDSVSQPYTTSGTLL
jgi:hypothetical protein